jgi:hypothetical protein
MDLVTLAELNGWLKARGSAGSFATGKAGTTRRGMTGAHVHVIRTMVANGHEFTSAMCAPSAQVGAEFTGVDTDTVSCSKCRAWLTGATKTIRGV